MLHDAEISLYSASNKNIIVIIIVKCALGSNHVHQMDAAIIRPTMPPVCVVHSGYMVQDRNMVWIEVEWEFNWYHFRRPTSKLISHMGGVFNYIWGLIIWHWNYGQTVKGTAKRCIHRAVLEIHVWTFDWYECSNSKLSPNFLPRGAQSLCKCTQIHICPEHRRPMSHNLSICELSLFLVEDLPATGARSRDTSGLDFVCW